MKQNANQPESKEIRIPGGHGRAFEVKSGQYLFIIDLEGKQVADFIAFSANNLDEVLSPQHTRVSLMSINLAVGNQLRTNLRNPMFEIIEDKVKKHDILIPACDERRYLVDYGVTDHRSCVDNFTEALKPFGITGKQIPEPFNIFQNTTVQPNGKIIMENCLSGPGDYIVLRALMDTISAVSACPMDLNPIGGNKITDLMVKIQNDY